MAGCTACLSFLPSLSCDSRTYSETVASVFGKKQPISTSNTLKKTTSNLTSGIYGSKKARISSSNVRTVSELVWPSSSFVHAKRSDRRIMTQTQQKKQTERGISRASLNDHSSKVAEKDSKTEKEEGSNAEPKRGRDTEHDSELLTRVKDTVKDSVDSVKGSVKGSVDAVREAVVEEAAIVVDAVEKGVEVAAKNVSLVGELPIEVEQLDSADRQRALATVGFWVFSAVAFGLFVGYTEGSAKASEFFAGYLLEQSLSVDNLLVFVLIFGYFKVPIGYQGRVLTYGLAGAVLFRGIMIGLGVATVQAFSAVNLVFAAILLFSSYKLLSDGEDGEDDLSNNSVVKFCQRLIPVTDSYDGDKFYTVVEGVQKATPLLLTLAVVEISDIVFAVDSIPAVFGVTRDPLIVFSSNIFAILGLRSLYLLVSTSMADLHYLQPSVAVVLGFIGSKMISEFFGLEVPTELSLAVVATVLGGGVFLSVKYPKED